MCSQGCDTKFWAHVTLMHLLNVIFTKSVCLLSFSFLLLFSFLEPFLAKDMTVYNSAPPAYALTHSALAVCRDKYSSSGRPNHLVAFKGEEGLSVSKKPISNCNRGKAMSLKTYLIPFTHTQKTYLLVTEGRRDFVFLSPCPVEPSSALSSRLILCLSSLNFCSSSSSTDSSSTLDPISSDSWSFSTAGNSTNKTTMAATSIMWGQPVLATIFVGYSYGG